MTETKLSVPDMVEGSLNALSSVNSNADFEPGVVEVTYDEDRVTPETIEGAEEAAGYTVAS